MIKKLLISLLTVFLVIPVSFAQTGLFSSEGAGNFATTGILFVVVIIIFIELFKKFFKKNKK